MIKILFCFVAVSAVIANDLIVGNDGGRRIFDGENMAGPTVWQQVKNVTVNATESEIISRINITDLRQNKDGEAKILEGGIGQKYVVIELKSPAVFRGLYFHIDVFAVPDRSSIPGTFNMSTDTDVNADAQPENENATIHHPGLLAEDKNDKTLENRDENAKTSEDNKEKTSNTKRSTTDPIATYVSEKAMDLTTVSAQSETATDKTKSLQDMVKNVPKFVGDLPETTQISETEGTTFATTEAEDMLRDTANPNIGKQYDTDVSKKIGHNVVFGAKSK